MADSNHEPEPDGQPVHDGTAPSDVVPVERQPIDEGTRQRLRDHDGQQVFMETAEVTYDRDGLPNSIGARSEPGTLVIHPDLLDDDEQPPG